ncbi:proline-rich AKT1 substrate 1-like [Salvia splendens]|uniref:proline-rich AKT1 substrate 1-like n=1 Tax=Salvia splendens TaxID=180675 RepID=UPI001C274EC3|nr:proline-rich AKT1 substrate 1-like [Salvia splendens]
MGKKAWAKKVKATPILREEVPVSTEERPPSPPPQQQPPAPAIPPPPMISLDAMVEFLQQQDPNRDWTAALAGFGQMRGAGAVTTEAPPEPVSHTRVQSEEEPPLATVLPETSEPDSVDLDAIAAHYDSSPEEHEVRISQEQKTQEEGGETETTPTAEPIPQGVAREDIDLNETARKQGLMTDEEF